MKRLPPSFHISGSIKRYRDYIKRLRTEIKIKMYKDFHFNNLPKIQMNDKINPAVGKGKAINKKQPWPPP